jgi:5-methylcytosine-specific restriction endonuclease McrA
MEAGGSAGPATGSVTDSAQIVLHNVWIGISHSPLTLVGLTTLGVLALLGLARVGRAHEPPNQQARRFSRSQRSVIFARAGGRCERHGMLAGRCRADAAEADHIHPFSRGGATSLSNGQGLCRRHNRSKRAHIPRNFQIRALERRRSTYFPAGQSVAVVRKPPLESPPLEQRHRP